MSGLATDVRRGRRGISLVELLVAMAGVSVVVTTTAMLLHGGMRAQSEARRFLDEERGSARLARAFRADIHAAIAASAGGRPAGDGPAADGGLVSLRLPDGGRIDYRLRPDSPLIERRRHAADGSPVGPREDYAFAGPVAATVTVDGDAVRLEIGAPDGSGGILAPGTALPPRTSGEARRRPPALVVVARIGHDQRFAPRGGEESR